MVTDPLDLIAARERARAAIERVDAMLAESQVQALGFTVTPLERREWSPPLLDGPAQPPAPREPVPHPVTRPVGMVGDWETERPGSRTLSGPSSSR
jgi:hypothetical protein